MLDKLVIYIRANTPTHPDWVVINADGECKDHVVHGNPSHLAALASQSDVIVIVPAESILLTAVTLPKMNRARLLKALPYALEEQLVDDVDTLHFASGEFQANGELPVAIVAREKMESWLALFQEWQIKPDKVVPLTMAVPLADNAWHVVVDNMANVRTDQYQGFACDQENLMDFLNLAMTAHVTVPAHIYIHNASKEACAPALRMTAKIDEQFIDATQLIDLLARAVNKAPLLNLLQGQFTIKKARLPQTDKMLKGITLLAASWVAILFLYPVVSYMILSHRANEINAQISQIYKRNFPAASSMVAPKLRMDDKLRKLEAQIGENRLLLLMGYIGKGLANAGNVKLKRLDFQGGQLTLELTAASSDDFSNYADFLTGEGLSVKQQNATLSGARVNATLQVE